MSEKPTLQDIAAMPYPQSIHAMRKFYNPNWGMPVPEDAGELRKFKVRVEYTYTNSDSRTYTVDAVSKVDAEAAAEAMFDKDITVEEDASLDDMSVSEVEDA
ncbi:hypothetical protein CA235_18385 [Sphingomonas sp. ABOLF]|uniref:hypothetical protein n=1 Tax=Sphingomonas sp. ABOLF TaxID=1985879 RepID=UPI000F7E24DB|nr:hypothetical protein [Sphingomonas sp. ABOLF]RSV11639.1 hypothetical protein CA235_18385 [Sphingomonas sp. ABOLF]